MIYFCCDDNRRALAGKHPTLNGIDFLEVVDREATTLDERQRTLRIFFCQEPSATLLADLQALTENNVQIFGGERTRGIEPDTVTPVYRDAVKTKFDHLEVHVTPRGDFSPYTLKLVEDSAGSPLEGLDPELASTDFRFKVECENPFDCLPRTACRKPPADAPEIDYLAKDYASFRQLMLDRMAVLLPEWRERNPADLGMTLVELLAYVGDRLSYRQDAVATEAYLGTALHRESVRRHARLLDYAMHDGCNARVWVQVRLKQSAPSITLPRLLAPAPNSDLWVPVETEPVPATPEMWRVRRTRFLTRVGKDAVISEEDFRALADAGNIVVFEPLHGATLFPEHNEMRFHTYGSDECCLPKGAVKATLSGAFPNLKPGDVLVFAEVIGPNSGNRADADTGRRHAVRLTRVTAGVDPLFRTADDGEQPVTGIEWGSGDALPFPFCLASVTESGSHVADVSVAWGNIVLADHGMSLYEPEEMPQVPSPSPFLSQAITENGCGCGDSSDRDAAPARYNPRLKQGPVTQAATITRSQQVSGQRVRLSFDPNGSAASAFQWDTEHLLPAVRIGCERGLAWLPRRDLLSSDPFGREFVAETDNEGRAGIRFGDDEYGMRPGDGMKMYAMYRVGNGAGGNLGANAIVHVVADTIGGQVAYIDSVTNPMPARGGIEPETLETVKQFAPAAFRIPKRAVTPDDYARMAELHPEVQRAAATIRWTGSWHTIYLTVDRTGGRPVDSAFEAELRRYLEPFRMAGHDLEIDAPRPVSLDLKLKICVLPDYFRSDVHAALQEVFSSGIRPDGSPGFFHPDNFTFGQPVYLSRIYAAAQSVAGVRFVEVTALQRLGETGDTVPADGVFTVGRLEIIRLDSDPNFPDRGRLTFTMEGGR